MTAEMDAALARLHSQEAAIKEQQNIVNSNGSNPFAEQIARQIDDRLAPQAETLSSQANLIKSLEATLAAQATAAPGSMMKSAPPAQRSNRHGSKAKGNQASVLIS